MTEFGAIWDPPRKVRSREVRTWPPLVAISTSRSDLRRSGRLLGIIFRSPPSAIAYDDADAISDELAQSGANLDLERIPRARPIPLHGRCGADTLWTCEGSLNFIWISPSFA